MGHTSSAESKKALMMFNDVLLRTRRTLETPIIKRLINVMYSYQTFKLP